NLGDHGGNTPLMGATFKGHLAIAQMLIDHGANLDAQHANGGTALMFAAMFGRNDLVKYLLDRGANKDVRDARGLTVFDLATLQGNDVAVKYLLAVDYIELIDLVESRLHIDY